jgi:hypothetical protein
VPQVIPVGSDDFRSHIGRAWRLVAAGSIIRVSDLRSGEVLGYVSRQVPAELAGHEAALPGPGVTDDLRVWDEPPPEPSPWVVRQVPEREQAGAA